MLEKFMALNLAKLFADYNRSPDLNVSNKPRERGERLDRPERAERGYEEATGEKHTYFVSIGRMDNVDPGQLLRILCDHLNTDRTHIGKIDLKHNFSFIQLIGLEPTEVMKAFKDFEYKGRPVRVNQAENESGGGGDRERPARREGGFGGGERSFGGERKSFGDRKPYEKKSFGSSSDRPYEKKSFGDRKPYEKKSFGSSSDKPYEKKSFGSSADRPQRRSSVSENPGKGFGKPDKVDRGGDGGDWKKLMDEGSDRKKKFGKKKF
jgi:ATP-dependent RNA helicase DeaD